jgi:hypothetical protein
MPRPTIDDRTLDDAEMQVYAAAFARSANSNSPEEIREWYSEAECAARIRATRELAENAVRWFRIALLTVVCLCAFGCSEVRIPSDGGLSDAAGPNERNGCSDIRNTLDTWFADCERSNWFCPWSAPVFEERIQACNLALYEARGNCDAVLEILNSPECEP